MMLAIETGIPVSTWWDEDPRDLSTALDVMDKERERQQAEQRAAQRGGGSDGRVMGGGG